VGEQKKGFASEKTSADEKRTRPGGGGRKGCLRVRRRACATHGAEQLGTLRKKRRDSDYAQERKKESAFQGDAEENKLGCMHTRSAGRDASSVLERGEEFPPIVPKKEVQPLLDVKYHGRGKGGSYLVRGGYLLGEEEKTLVLFNLGSRDRFNSVPREGKKKKSSSISSSRGEKRKRGPDLLARPGRANLYKLHLN